MKPQKKHVNLTLLESKNTKNISKKALRAGTVRNNCPK